MVEIQQLGGGGNKPNEVCRLIAGLLHLPPVHRLPAAAACAVCEYYSAMCKYFAGIQTLQTSLTPHGQWTFPGEAELNFPTKFYFITFYISKLLVKCAAMSKQKASSW